MAEALSYATTVMQSTKSNQNDAPKPMKVCVCVNCEVFFSNNSATAKLPPSNHSKIKKLVSMFGSRAVADFCANLNSI